MRSLRQGIISAGVALLTAACSSSPPTPSAQAAASDQAPTVGAGQSAEHTFTIPVGETVRAYLAKGTTYRAELDGQNVGLSIRPMESSMQRPLIEKTLAGTSASGTLEYTITTYATGEYEFFTTGGALEPLILHLSVVSTTKGKAAPGDTT